MREELYNILQKIADDTMHNTYAGLHTMLRSDKDFHKKIERNYRLKSFYENHDFYLTASERQIHLMGFIDAAIWFSRSGYFANQHEDDCDDELEIDDEDAAEIEKRLAQAAMEHEAIQNAIISFETGEDW